MFQARCDWYVPLLGASESLTGDIAGLIDVAGSSWYSVCVCLGEAGTMYLSHGCGFLNGNPACLLLG